MSNKGKVYHPQALTTGEVEALVEAGTLTGSLRAAIECVLLDHMDQLSDPDVDANLSELAYVYEQLTGWTVERELDAVTNRQTED
jgi:hypothetical protein